MNLVTIDLNPFQGFVFNAEKSTLRVGHHGLDCIGHTASWRWKIRQLLFRTIVERKNSLIIQTLAYCDDASHKFDIPRVDLELLVNVAFNSNSEVKAYVRKAELVSLVVEAFLFNLWDLWVVLVNQMSQLQGAIDEEDGENTKGDDSSRYRVHFLLALDVEAGQPRPENVHLCDDFTNALRSILSSSSRAL